jgi:hypothetical protein
MENAGTSKQLEAILMEHAGLSKCLLNGAGTSKYHYRILVEDQ